jgi:putative FmdB family regulatory protein
MPNYAYRAQDVETACEHCAERFVVIQRISDDPLSDCPECQTQVRRVIMRSHTITNRRYNTKAMLSDGNLKRLGFKKLVKESDGKYVDVLQD